MKNILLLAVCLFTATSNAAVILDFEGVGSGEKIDNFYNGGTDSAGNSGTDYGISFGDDALACVDSDATNGFGCNIANEPSEDTVMFFTSGSSVLNSFLGFDTGFSFFYSSARDVLVNVYSGLNLTGDLLGSINLARNYQDGSCVGDPTGAFCNWDIGALSFAGTAHSIDFGGTANYVAFDNITFGSTDPTGVPEPISVALFGIGLSGMFLSRRKKAA